MRRSWLNNGKILAYDFSLTMPLPAFLETQTKAAMQALQWTRESGLTDPAGQTMARDYAIQALLEYPPPTSVTDEGEEIPDDKIGEAGGIVQKMTS